MLKLSDAIRLGSMMKPQAYNESTEGSTCALQAACDAIGLSVDLWESLATVYPWMGQSPGICPACADPEIYVGDVVWHLNDEHRWTRERIADWVESIERQQEAVQPVPTSCWECSERIEDGVHDCPLKGVIL